MISPNKSIMVRAFAPADESRWRELFDGYNRFYGREPDDTITRHMLARANDSGSPVHSIVAVDDKGNVVGLANYLTHESTTQIAPVCYLQDLFVDPPLRGAGIGGRLIDWLIAEMKRQRWARLYWNTAETNYRGRMLYDKYTLHNGFLKYALENDASA